MAHPYILKLLRYARIAIALLIMIAPKVAKAETTTTDYIFLVNSDRQNCQQIGDRYQQINAFETTNFYVNICQKEDKYYYLGEAKTGAIGTIFLPAEALTPGKMYRADNGNVSYFVAISPEGAILTVERNGAPVVVETQIKQCLNSHAVSPVQIISQIDFFLSDKNSDRNILSDISYVKLNPMETIELAEFYQFQSFKEYNAETILNALNCR